MSTITCLGETDGYFSRHYTEQPLAKISGCRHAEHSDLPHLQRLIRPTTYEIFGDVKLGQLYEISCLSVVQYNENHELVSGICLCNYPNVTSVPPCDWIIWLETIYGTPLATEVDTMFVHLLVWDERYTSQFLKDLLIAIFDMTVYCQYVILMIPPLVTPENMFEQEMIKVLAKGIKDTDAVQFLYFTARHQVYPKLKIRRAVEEDNDDLISIIDGETTRLREFYGEYYISEMVRYPDSCRQLIIGEDIDGLTVGVMCLNSTIDINLLSENFELAPFNGLRKPHKSDKTSNNNIKISNESPYPVSLENSEEYSQHTKQKLNNDLFGTNKLTENIHGILKKVIDTLPVIRDGETLQLHDTFPQLTYHGEINAFVLELFAMSKGMRSQWSRDFLEAAFDCFPDLEYCVILLPFSHPYFQFLQHFVRVPLGYNKDFPMTLYVIHRAILFGKMKCHRAEVQDRQAIEELLLTTSKKDEILANFDLAINSPQLNLYFYVFKCNDTMIGLAILRAEKEINFIRRYYHIEDYISMQNIPQDSYGCLLYFLLMPIFSAYHHFFFCEIARLSDFVVILHRIYHENENILSRIYPSVTCLDNLIPINPRRQAEFTFPNILKNTNNLENNIKDKKNNDDDTFSLFMITSRLAMIPLITIDMKIVVVGASDCGIAFAEYLALRSMQHYVQFTNITLISPHGLPFSNKRHHTEICLLPFRGRYCAEYRRCVIARSWINVVNGTMTAINRKEKYVTMMNNENLAYDYLVLTCGLQYQQPMFQEEAKAQKREITSETQVPWNCLTINDDTEACSCFEKIRLITENFKKKKTILFYGHNIDCYCALRGLIEFGIKPFWITLIEPSLNPCETHDSIFFNQSEIDEAVMDAILQSGVKTLSEWDMVDWTVIIAENETLMIESVMIEKKGETRTLICDALFNFDKKTINSRTFLAFCHAGLIFDGLLVIDPEYRTNDPFIFAAGTVTKYSRRFYAESWQHKYYNSVEIGERLAQLLRKVITIRRGNEQISLLSKKENVYLTLPIFRAPIIITCILPGDYHYLHVCKPGKKALRSIAISQNLYGEVFVTGSCASEIGYFCIRLNLYDSVESVTCLNKKIFKVQNMIALYGKHNSMLNELKLRFRNSYISDLYAYFREPWATAILYDRFQCLGVENRATLLSRANIHDDFLVNDCIHALIKSKWEAISEEDRRYIESKYADSVYHQELEKNLMNFLEFCEDDLPMYCTLSKQRQMYMDIDESLLYFEQ